jgi:hypothetical protein
MPTLKLTQLAVERLKPPSRGRLEYWDAQLPGFGLRTRHASQAARTAGERGKQLYRVNGKLVRETLGTVAVIPKVDDARALGRESMRAAQSGVHPVQVRRTDAVKAALEAKAKAAETFTAAVDRYLKDYVEKNTRPATVKETRRIIERDIKPQWGTIPILDISRQDVNALQTRFPVGARWFRPTERSPG